MEKISFNDFYKIMSYDFSEDESSGCIEISFYIENDLTYSDCWLGKQIDKETGDIWYWYGLLKDGSAAYDYRTLDEFMQARVFNKKNIEEVWDLIILDSIDACGVDERLPFYLDKDRTCIL